ncbi:fido domain-containing protein, partial [Mycena epipterygia]
PYAVAAWIHVAFVSCHPFQDGNGRMSRILYSLPLLRADLPPMVITKPMVYNYIQALCVIRLECALIVGWQAQVHKDYGPLTLFIAGAIETTLKRVASIKPQDATTLFFDQEFKTAPFVS